ncbi:hypothetical protein [Pseudonocardia thermophila]|uniref:hypothetical protein n=1 Tax=Pseudonocardia thermophila TaxID=1848 RepID=UPI001160FCC8|nr:hypothetical protein [Pseudonocardia thermophila]
MSRSVVWASGRREPAPGAPRSPRRRRRLRRPSLLTAFWALVTLALLVVLTMTEVALSVIWLVLSAVATLLSAAADQVAKRPAAPPPPRPGAAAANPRGIADRGGGGRQAGTAVPRCTKTGQPIDECRCAQRHVKTADGARRYRLPVGSPMPGKAGGRAQKGTTSKAAKRSAGPRVPTTSNARPSRPPVGEVMRRGS